MRRVMLVLVLLLAGCSPGPRENPGGDVTSPPASASAAALPTSAGAPAASVAPPLVASSEPVEANCDTSTWGTVPVDDPTQAMAELYQVRGAPHSCYDRVVFDVNGPEPVGVHVEYVTTVTSAGKGDPVPVSGHAALLVTVRAMSFMQAGHQPDRKPWKVGDQVHGKVGDSVLQVKFAGEQHSSCSFAVGVSSLKPYRVTTWRQGAVMHVIVDIAH